MVSWTVNTVDQHRCSKKSVRVCALCVACVGLSFWLLAATKFWLWPAGKKRACGPLFLLRERGLNKGPQMLHFRPLWREQLWGQGEEMEICCENLFCSVYLPKFRKLFPVFGPGHTPVENSRAKKSIFKQRGTSSLNHYIITPHPLTSPRCQ